MGKQKDSERGGDYKLECYIEQNQIVNMFMINDEQIHFPIRSLVVKYEYLTWGNRARKFRGYVFTYYILSASLYQFTILIIGAKIQLRTIPNKTSSKL